MIDIGVQVDNENMRAKNKTNCTVLTRGSLLKAVQSAVSPLSYHVLDSKKRFNSPCCFISLSVPSRWGLFYLFICFHHWHPHSVHLSLCPPFPHSISGVGSADSTGRDRVQTSSLKVTALSCSCTAGEPQIYHSHCNLPAEWGGGGGRKRGKGEKTVAVRCNIKGLDASVAGMERVEQF